MTHTITHFTPAMRRRIDGFLTHEEAGLATRPQASLPPLTGTKPDAAPVPAQLRERFGGQVRRNPNWA